jgi:hypothetical protein
MDPLILTRGIKRRWMISFKLQQLYPRERCPGALWVGGWLGSGADLSSKGIRENSCLWSEIPNHLLTTELCKDDIESSDYMTYNFLLWGVSNMQEPSRDVFQDAISDSQKMGVSELTKK